MVLVPARVSAERRQRRHHGTVCARGLVRAVTVTDLDRSVAWYKEVLGLAELMREDHPDGNGYAVFGKVTSGMDVVKKIEGTATTTRGPMSDVPQKPIVIESATVVGK